LLVKALKLLKHFSKTPTVHHRVIRVWIHMKRVWSFDYHYLGFRRAVTQLHRNSLRVFGRDAIAYDNHGISVDAIIHDRRNVRWNRNLDEESCLFEYRISMDDGIEMRDELIESETIQNHRWQQQERCNWTAFLRASAVGRTHANESLRPKSVA
jgi:hypothetical protein